MLHLYGLIVGVAVVVWWSVAERVEPKIGKAVPWILGGAILGARAYHVIDWWEYYSSNPEQIVAVWNGGLGIWGGILGGIIGLQIYQDTSVPKDQRKAEFWSALGAIVSGLPLAQAIGRLGNAVNGEFLEKVWVLPWWGAEAALDLLLFVVIWFVSLRGRTSKSRVGGYLVGYGGIRFVLEFWRVNNWMMMGMGTAQWVSLVSVVIGLWLWRSNVQG